MEGMSEASKIWNKRQTCEDALDDARKTIRDYQAESIERYIRTKKGADLSVQDNGMEKLAGEAAEETDKKLKPQIEKLLEKTRERIK